MGASHPMGSGYDGGVKKAAFRLFACLSVAVTLAGCSTFQKDWERLAQSPALQSPEGRWDGTWKSAESGHMDRLRCIVERTGDGIYLARFHAKYGKFFNFGYAAPLHGVNREDGFHFAGEANLGWYTGGRYYYEGSVTLSNFFSTYRCKSDHGTFQMNRP